MYVPISSRYKNVILGTFKSLNPTRNFSFLYLYLITIDRTGRKIALATA